MKRAFFYCILVWSTIAILAPTIIFAQAKLETSVQSTAGGTAQSSSYSLVATVGQSTPPGQASSAQFALSGGFIYTLGNAPPSVANAIANQTLTSLGAVFTRDLNASPVIFIDPDGDALTYTASSSNTNIATASVSGSTLTVTAVAEGNSTIMVTADDKNGNTISTSFSVTVSFIINRPPVVANVIANQLIQLGAPAFTRDLNAAPSVFSDPDGDTLTYTASSGSPSVATVSITGSTLMVTPVSGGTTIITVTANDGKSGMISTMFSVKVNRPPTVANAIPDQTLQLGGSSFTRNLAASPVVFNDPDDDALTYSASSSATNITTANVSGDTLTVAPVAVGRATITVMVDDQNGGKISTMFTVEVNTMINRVPTVANVIPDQNLTTGGASFMRDLNAAPAVFNDPDNDLLNYTASSEPSAIARADISGSTLTVTPVAAGSAIITVTANDNRGGMVSTMFTVTVEQGNRLPTVANAIPNQRLARIGSMFTRDLNATPAVFNDADGDALAFSASSSAMNIAIASVPSGSSILSVTAVAAGTATITVTATDGDSLPVSNAFTVTVNQAPGITHIPVTMRPLGQAITITTSVTDDGGIDNVQLNYRRGGDATFTTLPMNSTGGNNYDATIPGSVVTSRGVEYSISATDVDNVLSQQPNTGIFSIQIQVTGETKPSEQPSGSVATTYRLISVPLQLDNPIATTVLEDDLGPYDDTKWRLFGLAPGTSQNINEKNPYVEFRTGGDLSPGKSLFLIVKDAGKFITAGAAKSVRTDQEFQITLQPGHNFIGTPFNFTIPTSKLRLQSGGAVTLRTFNGSFTSVTEMQPWEGYYLANLNQSFDILFVNPNLSSSAAPAISNKTNGGGPKPLSGWRLRVLASCAEAGDDYNFAGIAPESEDGYDDKDLAEPPPIGGFVSLYFPHPEWQKALSRFSDDIRSAANANHKWNFHVVTNIPGEIVKLQFEGVEEIDPALSAFVVDEELSYKQNLRENAAYQYQPRDLERPKALTLVVGKNDFVAEQTANVQGVPENFVLERNFPNPFNPETAIRFGLPQKSMVTIKIFDLAGHEVATLLDRIELPAGRHQRLWDGRDWQGRTVVSGIYFYRLTAGSFAKTMKLMVVR